jgi:hypothetical protein
MPASVRSTRPKPTTEVRKFLLHMEKVWAKLAAEKELELRIGAKFGT